MSTACITEVYSYMSYKCETPNQLFNLLPCKTSNGPKMAPLVEQEKTTGSEPMVVDHPDEQYASTETNSSENNSDTQPIQFTHENSELRDLPLSASPPNENGTPNNGQSGPYQQRPVPNCLNYFEVGNNTQRTLPDSVLPGCYFKAANMSVAGKEKFEFDGFYHCQKCEFIGSNDDELHLHSRKHDPYECGECGFFSDTLDNLITHIKKEHPQIAASKRDDFVIFHEPEPVETSPEPVETSPQNKKTNVKAFEESIDKPRKTTCKRCNNFTGNSKMEYYEHLKEKHSHVKLLNCPMCPFIALYKHHLQFHFRNHYGSKPFKCDNCNYTCVNKSMLNSHQKSHSDIYQYSCKNCQYMTKYLHSLKMHLRKYNHEPGRTLNPDGSVDKTSKIDIHGKRRGPRSKKPKREADRMQKDGESPKSKSPPSIPSPYIVPPYILPPQDIRILLNPQIHNNYSGNLCVRPGPTEATNYFLHSPPTLSGLKCGYCEFMATSFEAYYHHMSCHKLQGNISNGSLNSNYPGFYQKFGPPDFRPSFNPEAFSRNIVNQSIPVERRNINESRHMDIINNDLNFQNSVNNWNNYEATVNYPVNKEPFSGMATNTPFDGQQTLTQRCKENKIENLLTTSPNALSTEVKKEFFEYINGIENPSTKNPIENGPLDLSIKQPVSPETKNLETGDLRAFGNLNRETMNRALSASPKFENGESKVTTRKTNRRKGKAFKLNQYAMESEPLSDGIETELEKIRVFNESTFMNHPISNPAFAFEIKSSVPRINYKPTQNVTKGNGHNSLESKQPEFLPFPELAYMVPNCADPQTTRQKSREKLDRWCPHCDMYSPSSRIQEFHSSYHSENDPFTCAKCGLRCKNKDGLNSHIILGSRINGNCINSIEECKS